MKLLLCYPLFTSTSIVLNPVAFSKNIVACGRKVVAITDKQYL